jgi:hypothetical protein
MRVGDEARQDIDKKVERTAMAGMLNLGLIFELVINRLNDETPPQEQLIGECQPLVFHVGMQGSD